jgi:hypothetical protein
MIVSYSMPTSSTMPHIPFPKERVIARALSLLIGPGGVQSLRSLPESSLIKDSPLVTSNMTELKTECLSANCGDPSTQPVYDYDAGERCLVNSFEDSLSIFISTILTLSMFDGPEQRHENTAPRAIEWNIQLERPTETSCCSLINTNSPQNCALSDVLEAALFLVIHQPQKWPGGMGLNAWTISSCNGQVVYLQLFEAEILSWAPGLLRFDGEVYQLRLDGGAYTLDSTVLPPITNIRVTIPRNLCPDQEVKCRVSSADGWLVVTLALGKDGNYSPRSPLFMLKKTWRVLWSWIHVLMLLKAS